MNKYIIIIIFLAGLIFCSSIKNKDIIEGFQSNCPDLLIQKGDQIFLYNKKKATIPGVNPIKFDNLDNYVEFLKWQRGVGINCPVLYLQQTYDTQNNRGYRLFSDPLNPNGGSPSQLPAQRTAPLTPLFDAGRLDPPFNEADYPGFDPMNQYIGDYTPLDKIFHEKGKSDNPMDTDYGGIQYTERNIRRGKYKGNTRAEGSAPDAPSSSFKDSRTFYGKTII